METSLLALNAIAQALLAYLAFHFTVAPPEGKALARAKFCIGGATIFSACALILSGYLANATADRMAADSRAAAAGVHDIEEHLSLDPYRPVPFVIFTQTPNWDALPPSNSQMASSDRHSGEGSVGIEIENSRDVTLDNNTCKGTSTCIRAKNVVGLSASGTKVIAPN